MRKAMAGGVTALAATMVFAAALLSAPAQAQGKPAITPLNVKTGLWQATITVKITGLPPQMAAAANHRITNKSCLTPEKLKSGEDQTTKEVAGMKCRSVQVLKSTASELEVQGQGCRMGPGSTAAGHFKFHALDPKHVTGSLDITETGNSPFGGNSPIHSHAEYVSTWIGASCPADLN